MTHLQHITDRLHRTAKLALDTGEVTTIEDAERLFHSYRMQVVLGPNVVDDAALQAAALTAVNCGGRTLLGGVTVVGADSDEAGHGFRLKAATCSDRSRPGCGVGLRAV